MIGCGYLGAVHAAAMAHLGHEVIGIDVDAAKIGVLARGEAPFFEPRLAELVRAGIARGNLQFSSDMSRVRGSSVHFVAVGTPQRADGFAADLTHVDGAFEALLAHLSPGDIVAGKSTVPVGTATRLASGVSTTGATLVWNPEFLREGWAVQDTIEPDRLVVGVPPGAAGEHAANVLRAVYHPATAAGTPFIVTDYATAELVKVAANAFLATKISFINAMAEIAEVTGANVTELADASGMTDASGADSWAPGSASAAVVSRKTFEPSPPAPRNSGGANRSRFCARSTPSTCADATGRWTSS